MTRFQFSVTINATTSYSRCYLRFGRLVAAQVSVSDGCSARALARVYKVGGVVIGTISFTALIFFELSTSQAWIAAILFFLANLMVLLGCHSAGSSPQQHNASRASTESA